jgi:hypothetical protein
MAVTWTWESAAAETQRLECQRPGRGRWRQQKLCRWPGSPRVFSLGRPDSTDLVTTQDFIKFWGKIFVFILLVLIENPQGFKTF